MPCATPTDYSHAIQNPQIALADEELRRGEVARNARGLPMLWSGNFASVYRIHCPATGKTWAIKCFTRELTTRQDRYRHIAAHLEAARLPFTVPFVYLERGIHVHGRWYPAVKMEWIEGQTLNRFVEQSLDKPKMLRQLLELWPKLAARLREAGIAHADLQHGNVLLVPMPDGKLALRLIDYDGMYVPALDGTQSGELGHPNYQHPQRVRDHAYNAHVDRFSHLAIYCAVAALLVGRQELWRQFNNDDNLLFREADLCEPSASKVFHALWQLKNEQVQAITGQLAMACRQRLEDAPWLDELLIGGKVLPLTPMERTRSLEILNAPKVAKIASVVTGSSAWTSQPPTAAPVLPNPAVTDTRPVAVDGTVPAVGSEPIMAQVVDQAVPADAGPEATPRPLRGLLRALSYMGNRSVTGALFDSGCLVSRCATACVRGTDQLFRRLLGEENNILRYFFHAITAIILLICLGFGATKAWYLTIASLAAWNSHSPSGPESPKNAQTQRKLITVNLGAGVQLELLPIPAGEFLMGSPDSEQGAGDDVRPQHLVQITKPFYLGKYEVTQMQWQAVMGANPSKFQGPNNPVETVSWDECQTFVEKLNANFAQSGARFALPTEAQWEYACRAGRTTKYGFGDDESQLGQYAWYYGNAGSRSHPVGQKLPNTWGLYDMHGNVFEWCADWKDDHYYANSPLQDPRGPVAGVKRVARGGCWGTGAFGCRTAFRFDLGRSDSAGFRVALVSDGMVPPMVPLLKPIADQTIEAGKPLTFMIAVDNADAWGAKLSYGIAGSVPGAQIDPMSGKFSWTPATDETPGRREIEVTVDTPDGGGSGTKFMITVTRPAQLLSSPIPPSEKEVAFDLGNGVKLEMVLIPAGEFMMGSSDSEKDAGGGEQPQHRVRITKPFYLGKYEVTQEQWQAVMGVNPSKCKGPKNPVEQINWDDCQSFLGELNARLANGNGSFTLPTEAQWEYACRAGSPGKFCFGDDEASLHQYAWYMENSGGKTHPVGEKRPNVWGLFDMHGNVEEWCADWCDTSYYARSPSDDPPGPQTGSNRMSRGGGWDFCARDCRSAKRSGFTSGRYIFLGVRISLISADGLPLRSLRLQPIAEQMIEAGKPLKLLISVKNADVWRGKLQYSLAGQAPPGARIDPHRGEFSWTPPRERAAGTEDITVSVEGPGGRRDQMSFKIMVTRPRSAGQKELVVEDTSSVATMEVSWVAAARRIAAQRKGVLIQSLPLTGCVAQIPPQSLGNLSSQKLALSVGRLHGEAGQTWDFGPGLEDLPPGPTQEVPSLAKKAGLEKVEAVLEQRPDGVYLAVHGVRHAPPATTVRHTQADFARKERAVAQAVTVIQRWYRQEPGPERAKVNMILHKHLDMLLPPLPPLPAKRSPGVRLSKQGLEAYLTGYRNGIAERQKAIDDLLGEIKEKLDSLKKGPEGQDGPNAERAAIDWALATSCKSITAVLCPVADSNLTGEKPSASRPPKQ